MELGLFFISLATASDRVSGFGPVVASFPSITNSFFPGFRSLTASKVLKTWVGKAAFRFKPMPILATAAHSFRLTGSDLLLAITIA